VFRGLLIVTSAPLIGGFFALSALNQCLRKAKPFCPCTKDLVDDDERKLFFTKVRLRTLTHILHRCPEKRWRFRVDIFCFLR